jgi:serine/threonine protein kinase
MVTNGLGSKGWRFGAQLGRGGFGVVLEATCNATGRGAVAKRAASGKSIVNLRKEADLMSRVRHENVIKIYGVVADQYGRQWVIMERAYETLNLAVQRYGPWNDGFVARRGTELLSALQEVHYNGILHRDVHIDNVLMTTWEGHREPRIKLTDFGISKLLDDDYEGLAFTMCGRRYDVAPELVNRGYTSTQSDVYQAGLCMYYMATGQAALGPLDGTPEEAISSGIARQRAERLRTHLGRIIAKMLRRRDEFRYKNATEVLVDLQMFLIFSAD